MSVWLDRLLEFGAGQVPFVQVTVADTRGSAPREVGAKMLVSAQEFVGTIGGGRLEFKAVEIAREVLRDGAPASLRRFPLGASLGQCCGGVVVLLFEPISVPLPTWVEALIRLRQAGERAVLVGRCDAPPGANKLVVTHTSRHGSLGHEALNAQSESHARAVLGVGAQARLQVSDPDPALMFEPVSECDFRVVLFGAGHVGKALVQVLAGLECHVTWVDSREDTFPPELPANVIPKLRAVPEAEVDRALPDSLFLIMTHSHALDQEICERVLNRGDFRYCGLIGSASKRRRFERRLQARGVADAAVQRLTCPIGIAAVPGKRPGEIAVAVAAQLLEAKVEAIEAKVVG